MTLSDVAAVPHGVWLGVAALLGLIFGSFVTALSHRIPRGQNFIHARSQCPACGGVLATRDLVPVISWVVNRARCRVCTTKISVRYPIIELITALVFMSAVAQENHLSQLGLLLAAGVIMMTLVVIDLETRKLPLALLAVLAVVCTALRWRGDLGEFTQGLLLAAGIVVVGLALAAATRARTGTPMIGAGDTYALSIAAIALPWEAFGMFLALASILGLALGLGWRIVRHEKLFPFAPALFAALWLTLLLQDRLLVVLV